MESTTTSDNPRHYWTPDDDALDEAESSAPIYVICSVCDGYMRDGSGAPCSECSGTGRVLLTGREA